MVNFHGGRSLHVQTISYNDYFSDYNLRICRAKLTVDTRLLKFGSTDLSAAKEARVTKKGNEHRPQKLETMDARERLPADEAIAPVARNEKKYLRMILWACLSIVFLGAGSLASGLLSQEESAIIAILLFLAALVGAAGCIFYFCRLLGEISSKPKPPFISTLH
jgi:hypothetical protein